MHRILLFLLASLACLGSCTYDNGDELLAKAPAISCDTTATYQQVVSPIMDRNCRDCHSHLAPAGNINLDGYTQARRYAQNGLLMGVVTHANGFQPMPYGGAKLSDCDIAHLKKWVDEGAPDN